MIYYDLTLTTSRF